MTATPDDASNPAVSAGIPLVTFEDRFASLEDSNRSLAGDVRALTATLQVVSDLQVEQREINRRNTETEARVSKVAEDTQEKIRRQRNTLNMVTIAAAILLPLVSIVVYLSLIQHVNTLLNQQAYDRNQACLTRNAGTTAEVQREEALAGLESSPEAKAIHRKSAATIAATKIDCAKLYAPVGAKKS